MQQQNSGTGNPCISCLQWECIVRQKEQQITELKENLSLSSTDYQVDKMKGQGKFKEKGNSFIELFEPRNQSEDSYFSEKSEEVETELPGRSSKFKPLAKTAETHFNQRIPYKVFHLSEETLKRMKELSEQTRVKDKKIAQLQESAFISKNEHMYIRTMVYQLLKLIGHKKLSSKCVQTVLLFLKIFEYSEQERVEMFDSKNFLKIKDIRKVDTNKAVYLPR